MANDRLVIQYHQGIAWTENFTNASPTWKAVANLPSGGIYGCDVSKTNYERMYIAGGFGVYVSNNWQSASASWTQKLTIAQITTAVGFTPLWQGGNAVADLAVSPLDADVVGIVACSTASPGGTTIGISTDGGDNWTWSNTSATRELGSTASASNGSHSGWLHLSANTASAYTVGLTAGEIHKTGSLLYDGPGFWAAIGQVLRYNNAGDVRSVFGFTSNGGATCRVQYLDNATPTNATPEFYVEAGRAIVECEADGVLYALSHGIAGNTTFAPDLYTSSDQGVNWTNAHTFSIGFLQKIAVGISNSDYVAVLANSNYAQVPNQFVNRVQISTDAGATFSDRSGNLASILTDAVNYASTAGRIFWIEDVTPTVTHYTSADAIIRLANSTGTLVDISGDVNAFTIEQGSTVLDDTGMGDTGHTTLLGLSQSTRINLNGFVNSTTDNLVGPMMVHNSSTRVLEVRILQNYYYNGVFHIGNYVVSGQPDTLEAWSATATAKSQINRTSVAL